VHYAGALDALAHLPDAPDRRREQVDLLLKSVSVSFGAIGPDECLSQLATAETVVETLAGPDGISESDRLRLAQIHFWMGRAHFYAGALAEAIGYYQKVLPVAQELGDAELLAIPAATLGQVLVIQGRFGQAARLLRQAEAPLRTTGYWPEWILNQCYFGIALAMEGHREQALDEVRRGAERARAMKHERGRAETQIALFLVSFSQGDMRATADGAEVAIEIAERAGEWINVYVGYLFRGWAESRLGCHEEASASLAHAEEITRTRLGGRAFMADWMAAAVAELALNAGHSERAAACADEAVRIAAASESLFGAGVAYRVWGEALTPQGLAAAGPHFAESVRAFEDGEAWLEAGRAELAWGLACESSGDVAGMQQHLERARARLGSVGPTAAPAEHKALP
jgi:tetratricopeptide (TPR) repeat protein